jgi:hypothetical protein
LLHTFLSPRLALERAFFFFFFQVKDFLRAYVTWDENKTRTED